MTIEGLEFLDSAVQMPLVKLPVRTVVVPLSRGRVMVSPGSNLSTDALARAGAVTDIVAPSLFHMGGVKAAAAVHPQARLWGPPGCRAAKPDVAWGGELGSDAWPHADELPVVTLAGMPKFQECVFFHRASRSLLVSDLVFNVTDAHGLGARIIFSIFGTYRRLGVSRLFLRFVKDRAAFAASVAQLAALDFEHLVPSHGDIVTGTGKTRLLEALRERGFHA